MADNSELAQKSSLRSRAAIFALSTALFIYFFSLWNWSEAIQRTVFYVFQTRDLNRALELLRGVPIFFGPEMTGGGTLPGAFYYLLLACALAIHNSWQAAWVLMIVLAGCSAVCAWFFLRFSRMTFVGFLWMTLFVASPLTQHFFMIFINPSYGFFFSVLAVIGTCFVATASEAKSRNRAFILSCWLIGFSVQIHFSLGFFLPALLLVYWRSRKNDRLAFFAPILWWGLAGVVIPLLPYATWFILAHEFLIEVGQASSYVGTPGAVPSTLFYLFTDVANLSWDSLMRVVPIHLLKSIPWSLPLLVATYWVRPGQQESMPEFIKKILRPLLVCALFTFIPFSYVFAVPIANRYGLPFHLVLIFITVVLFAGCLGSRRRLLCFNLLSIVAISVAAVKIHFAGNGIQVRDLIRLFLTVIATVGLSLFYLRSTDTHRRLFVCGLALTVVLAFMQTMSFLNGALPPSLRNMPTYAQWKAIWMRIYAETGWTYEEAEKRIYLVNAHIDGDPRPGYEAAIKDSVLPSTAETDLDGYFIVLQADPEKELTEWLREAPIADEIREGLQSGDIELGRFRRGKITVIPYRVKSTARVPKHFHNMGLFYHKFTEGKIFTEFAQAQGIKKLAEGEYLFYWNECPDRHPYCDTGAVVRLTQEKPGQVALRVRVVGESLSQVSPWIHPSWTMAWDEPYVEIQCGGEVKSFLLATSIGYKRKYLKFDAVTGYFVSNNSLIAPFERTFEVECKGVVSHLSVGRKSATVDKLRWSEMRSAQKLTQVLQ